MLHSETRPNGATAPSIAQQRQAAYTAASLPTRPTVAGRGQSWRTWAIAASLGLLVGMTGTVAAYNNLAPLAGARQVRNAIVTTQADGAEWFLVAGWAVPIPKAGGQ